MKFFYDIFGILQGFRSESITVLNEIRLVDIFNEVMLKNISSSKTEVFKRLRAIESSLQSKARNNYIQFTNTYKIIWNKKVSNNYEIIGNFLKNNLNVIVMQDKVNNMLYLNHQNSKAITKTSENFNVTLTKVKEGSVLHLWWRIPNIPQEFFKIMKVDLSAVININTFEISNETNVIILKIEEKYYLYKLDTFQHDCVFVGEFEYIEFVNNWLFLKQGSTLKIFNNEFQLVNQLHNIDVMAVFEVKGHVHIVSFAKSDLMFYSVENDGKPTLLQQMSIDLNASEIECLTIGSNHFIAIYFERNGGTLQFYKLTANLKWKFYTSTVIPELNKIVRLRDDTLAMLLFSQQFKNSQILTVV